MIIHVEVDGPEFESPEFFALYVLGLCNAMLPHAREQVKRLPPLFQSGVRFRPEPVGYESFVPPSVVYRRGYGDCQHLCLWRVAELQNAGDPASFKIQWMSLALSPQRMFHVQTRSGLPAQLPIYQRPFEDTSVLLGMPQGSNPL